MFSTKEHVPHFPTPCTLAKNICLYYSNNEQKVINCLYTLSKCTCSSHNTHFSKGHGSQITHPLTIPCTLAKSMWSNNTHDSGKELTFASTKVVVLHSHALAEVVGLQNRHIHKHVRSPRNNYDTNNANINHDNNINRGHKYNESPPSPLYSQTSTTYSRQPPLTQLQ